MPVQELSEKAEPTIGYAATKPAGRSDTATLIQLFKAMDQKPTDDNKPRIVDSERSEFFSSEIREITDTD